MGYRQDFPIFAHADEAGQPYLYLDNASSTQTPQAVIDAVTYYYTHCGSNVHRGNYKRAELTSILYDQARRTRYAQANYVGGWFECGAMRKCTQ